MKAALTIASLLALAASAAIAGERTITLAVANMTCALCPIVVKQSLERVPGVKAVEVFLEERTAVVTFDDAATSVDVLTKATGGAGYPAALQEDGAS
jgi:periplasmic mercuric ion binding protein